MIAMTSLSVTWLVIGIVLFAIWFFGGLYIAMFKVNFIPPTIPALVGVMAIWAGIGLLPFYWLWPTHSEVYSYERQYEDTPSWVAQEDEFTYMMRKDDPVGWVDSKGDWHYPRNASIFSRHPKIVEFFCIPIIFAMIYGSCGGFLTLFFSTTGALVGSARTYAPTGSSGFSDAPANPMSGVLLILWYVFWYSTVARGAPKPGLGLLFAGIIDFFIFIVKSLFDGSMF